MDNRHKIVNRVSCANHYHILYNYFFLNMEIADFVSKRSKKSPVWLYFGFPVINGVKNEKITMCKLCKGTVPYSGNTTTMASHLDRHHWSVVHQTVPGPSGGKQFLATNLSVNQKIKIGLLVSLYLQDHI